MIGSVPSGRVALVAAGEQVRPLLQAFRSPALQSWDAFVAEDFAHAHFLVQMDACDVLVVDHSALGAEDDLGRLTGRPEVPILFLSANDPEVIFHALSLGARQWLPRDLVLAHPATLDAALHHAVLGRAGAWRARRAADQLRDSRAQVGRLANLLWDATPTEGRPPWFSQRYMLQRLHEEVCRSRRHGGSLALVLGEVRAERDEPEDDPGRISRWVSEHVNRSKRRSDVAGQYGPDGFMLLLPHTAAAGAAHYCRRLRQLLEEAPAPLLGCFGIAGASGEATPKGLLRHAEEQLDRVRAHPSGHEDVFFRTSST